MLKLPISLPVLLGLTVLATAHAQQTSPDMNALMPRCGPEMEGQIFCKFGRIYECQFVDPNSMERRTGWRWKPDILRACAEPRPAMGAPPAELPPGFVYSPQASPNSRSDQLGQGGSPNDPRMRDVQPSRNALPPQYRNYRQD